MWYARQSPPPKVRRHGYQASGRSVRRTIETRKGYANWYMYIISIYVCLHSEIQNRHTCLCVQSLLLQLPTCSDVHTKVMQRRLAESRVSTALGSPSRFCNSTPCEGPQTYNSMTAGLPGDVPPVMLSMPSAATQLAKPFTSETLQEFWHVAVSCCSAHGRLDHQQKIQDFKLQLDSLVVIFVPARGKLRLIKPAHTRLAGCWVYPSVAYGCFSKQVHAGTSRDLWDCKKTVWVWSRAYVRIRSTGFGTQVEEQHAQMAVPTIEGPPTGLR